MAATGDHRALRVLLFALSVLEALAGAVLLVAPGWALAMVPTVPNNGFVLAIFMAIGIVLIGLGYLLCVAARNPTRYVGVIDTLAFMCVGAAAVNVYGVAVLNLGAFYPSSYIMVRAIVQLALAVALIALRPKAASAAT
jgi:hypothetical protein